MKRRCVAKNRNIDEETLVADIIEVYEQSMLERTPIDEQNSLVRLFVSGHQYADITVQNQKTKLNPQVKSNKRVKNKMRTAKDKLKSRVFRNKPYPHAVPITKKERDIKKAKITNALVEDVWEKFSFEENLDNKLGEYVVNSGSAFIKTGWDKNSGKEVFSFVGMSTDKINENEYLTQQEKDKYIRMIMAEKTVYEGDVFVEFIPPEEILISNISCKSVEDAEWVMHSRAYSKELLKLIYNLGDDDFLDEDVDSTTYQSTRANANMGNTTRFNNYSDRTLDGHAVVREYYENPSLHFPKGRFIIQVGKKIVHLGDLPYEIGDRGERKIPIVRFVLSVELDNFYGGNKLADLIGVQRDYNANDNRIRLGLNKKSFGRLAIEQGSIDNTESISNKPYGIMSVKRGYAIPREISTANNLVEFFTNKEVLKSEMSELLGLSEYSPQSLPSSIRSGVSISMLYENEDDNILPAIKSVAAGITKVFKYIIRLYQQFTTEDDKRFVKYNRTEDENLFWNSELLTDNIHIKNILDLEKRPSQKKQEVIDLIQLGAFDKENRYGENLPQLIKALEVGGELDLAIPNKTDRDRADRENSHIRNGKPIIIDEFDNHIVHYKQHTDYIKSESWQDFIENYAMQHGLDAAKVIEETFRKHIKEHEINVKKTAMMIQAEMMQTQ